jgi:hypothetical protein
MAIILLFYILQNIVFTKSADFSVICYHTSFQDLVLSGASVSPTTQIS